VKTSLKKVEVITHILMDFLNCGLKRPINISLQANEKYIRKLEGQLTFI